MAYVIKRIPDGKYVAPSGNKKSYTRSISNARKFATKENARHECCVENERIVKVEEEITHV